jgi:hypothetical protein
MNPLDLETAEREFTLAVQAVRDEPYKLRRSLAAWPYYSELQLIVNKFIKPQTTEANQSYNARLYETLKVIPIFSITMNSDAWK